MWISSASPADRQANKEQAQRAPTRSHLIAPAPLSPFADPHLPRSWLRPRPSAGRHLGSPPALCAEVCTPQGLHPPAFPTETRQERCVAGPRGSRSSSARRTPATAGANQRACRRLSFICSQADFLVSAHFAPWCCPTTTINS